MKKANELNVKGTPVRVIRVGDEDFICLTDMAAGRGDSVRAADVIKNWLRARYTLEFLGTWESLHNPDFKVVEFDHFRIQAGLPNFVLSVSEWISSTNAIGLIVKNGRYGGTYAQKDIAFKFGQTHQQWQAQHPDLKGNQRDYADINQLICISNMENLNAVMIEDGISQPQRLKRLNEIAIHQMKILSAGTDGRNLLK